MKRTKQRRSNIIKFLFLWFTLILFPSYGSADVTCVADQKALAALSNPAQHSAEELQNATEYVMQKVASQYGYSQDELEQLKVIVYNDTSDSNQAFRQNDTTAVDGDIGVNASRTGLGTDTYYSTLGHEFGHMQQAQNVEDGTADVKYGLDRENYSDTVGNAMLNSINDGLYVAGRDDVTVRSEGSGLENAGNYTFTEGNNYTAFSVYNRDHLGSGSGGDNRYGLPMTNGLSFYDANIDEIRTGSIYGAASGAILFSAVLAAPTIAGLATTAYYATSAGVMTVATAANNTYYKVGAVVQNFSLSHPGVSKGLYVTREIAKGAFTDVTQAPSNEWELLGIEINNAFQTLKNDYFGE